MLTGGGSSAAHALTGTLNGLLPDANVNQVGGVSAVANTSATRARIGNNSGDGTQMSVVHVFQIPPAVLADSTQQFDTHRRSLRARLPHHPHGARQRFL
jgi:hypothetical protein